MQRNPLVQESNFSSWRLHERINSKTSHQVSLFHDLWHAGYMFDFIDTHELDIAEIIPHINHATLASHIASRIHWHIQLNCFGVSLPSMSCVTFLSLFLYLFL